MNKPAPYKTPELMDRIKKWWDATYPTNSTNKTMHIIDLYKSYQDFTDIQMFEPGFIDPNQFAKCLMAAKIIDIGGWWELRPEFEPKEYEIIRAKVH